MSGKAERNEDVEKFLGKWKTLQLATGTATCH